MYQSVDIHDILQVYYLVRHLFDHIVDTDKGVLYALGVSAELASQRSHTEIICDMDRTRAGVGEASPGVRVAISMTCIGSISPAVESFNGFSLLSCASLPGI